MGGQREEMLELKCRCDRRLCGSNKGAVPEPGREGDGSHDKWVVSHRPRKGVSPE